MTHLTNQQITGYQAGTLEEAEAYFAIESHLADCPTCQERLQSASQTTSELPLGSLLEGSGPLLMEEAHPEGTLIVRYARKNSDVPALIVEHIAVCTRCQQDVVALQTYRQAVTPAIWAEARAVLTPLVSRPGFGEWLRAQIRVAATVRAARVWAPAAAVCLLLGLFWWRKQPAVEILDGSGRWTLTRGGQLTGPVTLSPSLLPQVRDALQTRKLTTPPDLMALVASADAGYSPAGTFVRSDRPTLRWQPLPNAVSYQCTLTSPDAPGFKRGAPKPIRGSFWKVKKPLPRGKIYTWQVVATLRNGEHVWLSGSPRFKVLAQAQEQALEEASKTTANSHLALGLLYAQQGVLDEAAQEFAALQRVNPNSEIVQKFSRQCRHLMMKK